MSETPTVLRREVEPGIHLLELNRPERLNAISEDLLWDLHDELDALVEDRSARVVVLTGRGRGFCAGLDLNDWGRSRPPRPGGSARQQAGTPLVGAERASDMCPPAEQAPEARPIERSAADRMRRQKALAGLITGLRALPQPVIAATNGPAVGGGMGLALACDVRIAGRSAKFGDAFVRIGLSGCDVGVSWLLPRLIGASRAFELLLTGRIIDATEADRIGLVSQVVPDDQLLDTALNVARQIVGNSSFGVRMTKEVMWSQLEIGSMAAGIALENSTQIMTTYTADQQEAVMAFQQKRSPEFTGR